jgi:hypothetical protein
MRSPRALQLGGQVTGVVDDLLLQLAELLRRGQAEADGHAGNRVDVRPALLAREHGAVDLRGQRLVGRQDARAARAVQGLVRGEADDVSVADRAGNDARGHHAGDVRDVGQEVRADRIGDLRGSAPSRASTGRRCNPR